MFQNPEIAFPEAREIPYGPITITREDIIKFASEYDPAPFHLDEQMAAASLLGELIASGFHTCSLTMRMLCDAYMINSTCEGGAEVESVKWLAPVRPGDTLSGISIVERNRQSNSRPDIRIITFRNETYNQNGVHVLSMSNTAFFRKTGS